MDDIKAKKLLKLDDEFSQLELVDSYKSHVENIHSQLQATESENSISDLANKLFDSSSAYFMLRDDSVIPDAITPPPLIIFTDASVHADYDKSAFGIAAQNITHTFNFPSSILEKYKIRISPESGNDTFAVSGIILNFDIKAAEIIAIIAALEMFQFLAKQTGQRIVFYTDSLFAKKVLGDKRLPPGTKLFSGLRQRFLKIMKDSDLDIVIKKVAAHTGIELNELADSLAKKRLKSICR